MKLPPVLTDLTCPKCGAPMNLRIGKRGPWLGCSKFPKCRGRMAWNSLEEPVRLHWEEVMAEHIKANPAITITMIDAVLHP